MRIFCFVLALLAAFSFNSSAFAEEKLVFAIDIIRHGDRTPVQDLPAAPSVWKEGLGQLTPKGMRQEYELGSHLRDIYVEQYHLMPEDYAPETIYIRSSDFDRTLMSAQSFLMGLYPPGTGPELSDGSALPHAFQPIPIHTLPRAQETLLLPDHPQYHLEKLVAKYVIPTPEWKAKEAQVKAKFPAWSRATGVNITALYQLVPIADHLYIRKLYQVPMPAGLSEEDAQQIIEAGKWVFAAIFKNPQIGKITGKELLSEIKARLQKASRHESSLKYILFSAHDSTLESEMSALGLPLDQVPPYASHLNIALFDTGNEHYSVRLQFNNEPVVIPACKAQYCTLAEFLAL